MWRGVYAGQIGVGKHWLPGKTANCRLAEMCKTALAKIAALANAARGAFGHEM